MKTTLYFIRHGQTISNRDGKIQGWGNSDLTQDGISVAKRVGEGLKTVAFDRVYSSDLTRAYDTARYIMMGSRHGTVNDIEQQQNLRELSFGAMVGFSSVKIKQEIEERLAKRIDLNTPKEQLKAWVDIMATLDNSGQAEDFERFRSRIVGAVEDIVSENENKTVLIVSHGMMIKTLFTVLCPQGEPYSRIENGGVCQMAYERNNYHKLKYNQIL